MLSQQMQFICIWQTTINTIDADSPNEQLEQANLINDNDEHLANVEFPIEHSEDVIEHNVQQCPKALLFILS